MNRTVRSVHSQFYFPGRIFCYCLVFAGISLGWNGSLYNLYSLIRAQQKLEVQTQDLHRQILIDEKKLNQVKDLQFITREAIDHYEMVSANDLVFVFPEE